MRSARPWAGYLRLTEDRLGVKAGIGIQKRYIRDWAKRHGVEIAHFFQDTNISAGDEDVVRPQYEEMLQEVEAGTYGGIAIYKIDRLTRLSFEYERCVKITRRAGGFLAEAVTGRTTEAHTGIQMLRHDVSNAEAEIANIKLRVTANKQERSRRGFYHGGGRRPFGFEGPKRAKGGRLKNSGKIGVKHVPDEVALIREAASRRIEGESYTDIVRDWHSREPPVYGATGAPWNTKTLETLLTSPRMVARRVYRVTDPQTGLVTEILRKAKWKPVLDYEVWERLNALRTYQDHAPSGEYPLSGFAKCGRCGLPLTGCRRSYRKGGEMVATRTYRCRNGLNDKARGHCGRLSVLAEHVERVVAARILRRLANTREIAAQVTSDADPQIELLQLAEEIKFCTGELDALAKASRDSSQLMSATQLLAYRTPFIERARAAEARRQAILRLLDLPYPDAGDFDDLLAWWELLSAGQKQKLVVDFYSEIVVLAPGRSGRYFDPKRVVATPTRSQDANGARD